MRRVVKTIQCQLETITPVHIGTGNEISVTDYLIYEKPQTDTMGMMASQLAAALRDTLPQQEETENLPEKAFVVYNLRKYLQGLTSGERQRMVRQIGAAGRSFRPGEDLSIPAREAAQYWYYCADISGVAMKEFH